MLLTHEWTGDDVSHGTLMVRWNFPSPKSLCNQGSRYMSLLLSDTKYYFHCSTLSLSLFTNPVANSTPSAVPSILVRALMRLSDLAVNRKAYFVFYSVLLYKQQVRLVPLPFSAIQIWDPSGILPVKKDIQLDNDMNFHENCFFISRRAKAESTASFSSKFRSYPEQSANSVPIFGLNFSFLIVSLAKGKNLQVV